MVAWLLFPFVLFLLCLGLGLLLERFGGVRLDGIVIIPAGFAGLIVLAQLATAVPSTAKLAAPAAVVLAAVGIAAGWRRIRGLDRWAALAPALTFAVYAAPVVASGALTFTGYMKLDDTATWLALTDRVLDQGRSLEGLAPSTYEATLSFNLADGYPVGALLPFGIGSLLVGEELAWTFQPYLAFLAALLALLLYALARHLLRSPRWAAAVAALGAQASLLLGYALWGGVKEVALPVLLALVAVLAVAATRAARARAVLPLAVALCAAISAMSLVGAVLWTGPLILGALILALGENGRAAVARQSAWLVGATAALTAPWLMAVGLLPPTSAPLTSENAQGNLLGPLNPLQVAGVWPAIDFRLSPDAPALTYTLACVVLAAAGVGLWLAWRRKAHAPMLLVATTALAAGLVYAVGSPWVEAKGLAIASPVLLFFALATIATLAERGVRSAVLLIVAVAVVVGWSSALAYRGASLAPAERMAELEQVGAMLAGTGPTMTTEYEPYSTRHFLREGDTEGVSELRRRRIPLRGGGTVPKGTGIDLDRLVLKAKRDGVLRYRTLVLRRSPLSSRPPAAYRRVWSGGHYELWRRSAVPPRPVVAHLPLGGDLAATASAPCRQVLHLARLAGANGRLAAATRPRPTVAPLSDAELPAGWPPRPAALAVIPNGEGSVIVRPRVPRGGKHEVWLGGSTRNRVTVVVNGRELGSRRRDLSYPGQYMPFGKVDLAPGAHEIEVRHSETILGPGEAGSRAPLGPLVLAPVGGREALAIVPPREARSLCGRDLDWVEALGAQQR